MVVLTGQPVSRRTRAWALARTAAGGALAGALAGLLVGGVLGRLAMRLLAATSPAWAQGRMTDDRAVVGQVSLSGTLGLALFVSLVGAVGGLVYLWVRRVLPPSRAARVGLYGLFTGSVGGALFVHDHPSFDYTVLEPAWLSVLLFVALPLLFGVVVSVLVELADGPGGVLRRAPDGLVVALGALVALPTVAFTGPVLVIALVIALAPPLRRLWHSHTVTVVGAALFVLLVLWGVYGIVTDVVSIATDRPSTAPLHL